MMTSLSSLKAFTLAMTLLGTGTLLNSQDADVLVDETTTITVPLAGEDLGKTPAERLTRLRQINAQLLKKQEATLEKLEQLQKDAEQLRIFARRS